MDTKKYDAQFKKAVVLEVLSGKITKEEARRRYNIAGKSTVLKWMRVMAGIKASAVGTDPIPILRNMSEDENSSESKRADIEELREEVKRLKSALEYSELKGRAYQIMVEIAREQYNLDLEKKPGAKRSEDSKKKNPK